jgi:FAD:protein FMN transferase
MKHIQFRAMGSQMAVFLERDSLPAQRLLAQAPAWFEEWEQVLSRFRPDSDLSQLNRTAGRPVRVNPVLFEVIYKALETARWTQGLVTPTLLRPLESAGYAQSFDKLTTDRNAVINIPMEMAEKLPHLGPTDWRMIQIDAREMTITLPVGMGIDLGGIGKGWAAEQAMRRLEALGPVLVDASGDLAVSGPRLDGSPWPVAIADPLQVQENLGVLSLERCGVATSGIDYHRWMKNGAWQHHIIDPRTGEPAETDLLSVTVIAADAVQAEAAAKAVLIQGKAAGLEWLENQTGCSGLLAMQDGQVIYSRQIQDVTWS